MTEPARREPEADQPRRKPDLQALRSAAAVDPTYKWKVLGCVVFGIFMVILDTTVVNIAFPTMRDEFHATLADSQWIVSLYVLALGVTTPLAGYLSDRFGMKRMYLTGLATFVVGSLGSGLAPSLGALVVTRGIQGAGGGIAVPLGTAMLFAVFPPEEQGIALGFYGVALLMAPALGPILGGLLVDHGLWRWIFFVNIPVGIAGVTLGLKLLRERKQSRRVHADPLGLAIAVVAYGSLLYGASIAADVGWRAPKVLVFFGVGAVAMVAFVLVELFVARDPLLDFRLFRNLTFLNASGVGWVTVLALFGAEFLLPIYLQVLRGRSALRTGVILLPLAIVAGITTPIAGRLYDRIGPRALVIFGFGVLCVNTWQLSQLTADTSIGWIMFLMALRGLALGTTVQSTYTTALGTVDRMRVARGSSLVNSTRFVVQSIAVAVLATVVANQLSPQTRALQQRAEEAPATSQAGFALCEPTAAARAPVGVRAAIGRACVENLRGFEGAYRVTFYFAILSLLLGALLPGWPFGWGGREALRAADAAG